jgi:hypothetical protein
MSLKVTQQREQKPSAASSVVGALQNPVISMRQGYNSFGGSGLHPQMDDTIMMMTPQSKKLKKD